MVAGIISGYVHSKQSFNVLISRQDIPIILLQLKIIQHSHLDKKKGIHRLLRYYVFFCR